MSKKHSFLSKNESFWAKKYQNSCKNQYEKSLIYGWNVKKVIHFINAKNDWKKCKKHHFHIFFVIFHHMYMDEKSNYVDILHAENMKKYIKKHVKNGKSRNFQKVLKSSILLQITFWIAEKIAIDCFNPNPKYEENS